MYKQNLVINNLQELIYHKTKPTYRVNQYDTLNDPSSLIRADPVRQQMILLQFILHTFTYQQYSIDISPFIPDLTEISRIFKKIFNLICKKANKAVLY